MKTLTSLFLLLVFALFANAQPSNTNNDTSGTLKPQKENVITANTILKIENLGFRVNTVLPELRPTVSADGRLMFFICENHPENTKYRTVPNSQDIWYTEKDSAGKWQDAIHLGPPLNTMPYNAVYWISPDNNRILIRGSFTDGAFNGKGVSMSHMTKSGNWSPPNALNIKNYYKYDRGLQSGATMAHDGKTLLLYMTPEQGGYNNDIFVCFLEGNGLWSEPKNLGKIINSPDTDEMTPYLASDGVTLYFSSNRAGGVGDNDIWMTKRLDKSWTKWSTPVALPVPINTENWDAFWTMDAGGEYAYLTSSSNTLGESDIVRVKLLEREKPNPVVLVHGNVYNQKTKEPLAASLLYETMPDGVNAGNGMSSEIDGSFKVVLPLDKNYSIRATADKFFAVSESLMLDSLVKAGYKEIHKDLYLVPIEIGQIVRLNNVFFDFDKWDLRPESFIELDRVVTLMKENPTLEIEMSAHTDSHGSDDYNFKLSDNRARSVREYILSKGIEPSRIISQGYGETKPVVPNTNPDGSDSPENRQLNRRVEFKILKS